MQTPRRRTSAAHLCLALLYAAVLVAAGVGLSAGGQAYDMVVEISRTSFGVAGLIAAVLAARGPGLLPRARQAWRAVAVSFAVLMVTPVLALLTDASDTLDDVSHVAFVGALLIALQLFPLAGTSRRDRWKTRLDAAVVLVGGFMLLWFFAFGPYVDQHGWTGTVIVTAAVLPIVDLALLFSVARALLRGAEGSAQQALRPLAAGAMVLFAGDAVHGYLNGHGLASLHSPWQFLAWLTADALLVAAAVEQWRPTVRRARRLSLSARNLPYAAVAAAHALMLLAAVEEGSLFPWGGLALGGATISAIVLMRQALVQRESDERAVTDGLTGLANRARFRETSNRSLARGERTGRSSAVLVIDLNGFKEVNDTLGHKSGDLVLVEFAKALRSAVPSWGLPCRLGGDEFAVVLPDLQFPEQAYDVAGALASALAPVVVDGRLMPLAASIGIAVSGPGELTHDVIVHRADLAMYRAKRLGPQTRWAVWQESFEQDIRAAA
ncbi:diguanylate cyclase [Actinoplanes sp. LDG1-06]|uniref:Diguanylate cyclase n=1 Tax=Paractinoplanes ovalisporus TaxID=2810368 RepID=A0ABS2AFA0_9ACTN|nr:GGDEF domain-containing protein [Actinoplanes ovalisporus]MBM2618509.1 diguanylate cyclase [Actinoplanes ovalisporus]